jgi:hypothetical protein
MPQIVEQVAKLVALSARSEMKHEHPMQSVQRSFRLLRSNGEFYGFNEHNPHFCSNPWSKKGVIAIISDSPSLLRTFYASLIASAALLGMAGTARAQLYVSQLGILTVSEYNAATGAEINANLITRLRTPGGLALQGNTLFVANQSGTIGKYDAATGKEINANLITGLQFPTAVAVKNAK